MNKFLIAAAFSLLAWPALAAQIESADSPSFGKPTFPKIGAIGGDAKVITGKPEKETPVKVGMVLKEKALFQADKRARDSMVRVDLSAEDSIFIYPGADVDLPVIDPEKGTIEYIHLRAGKLRILIQSEAVRLIKSPLFSDSIGRGDYVFEMAVGEARFDVKVLKGSLSFRGLEGEQYQPLFEKDSAFFQGVLENGEIAYDILMHGKRVAKGNVGKISKLSAEDTAKLLSPLKTLEKAFVAEVKKKAPPPDPTLICKSPSGRLNECAWVCEGTSGARCRRSPQEGGEKNVNYKCIRRRCSAEGNWVDAYSVRSQEWRCSEKPLVTKCDY